MREHNECILPSGLKIIHEVSPTTVVYCGFLIKAGTRDEESNDHGMAHFCEHTTFKGTRSRSSWNVLNNLESVGGDLNAYTNKEETVYYAAVPGDEFTRAAKLLSDIVFNSTYPQKEINKEVEVIIDEIESYKDSPDELIFDEAEEMLFCGHPLGRSILGNPERLREYKTEDALRFTQRLYVPQNATFFVYGNINFKKIVDTIARATSDVPNTKVIKSISEIPPYKPQTIIRERGTHQAHVLIGGRAYGSFDDKRIGLFLLNNILGGPGMNSRLNLSLRERRGLVYTVESSVNNYTDSGVWSIYFGADKEDVEKCRMLVLKELRALQEKPLSRIQLSKAQKQIKGQLRISCDNFENYALSMGKVFAHYGHHRDIDRLCTQIDELTPEMLQHIATDIFIEDKLTTLIYR